MSKEANKQRIKLLEKIVDDVVDRELERRNVKPGIKRKAYRGKIGLGKKLLKEVFKDSAYSRILKFSICRLIQLRNEWFMTEAEMNVLKQDYDMKFEDIDVRDDI